MGIKRGEQGGGKRIVLFLAAWALRSINAAAAGAAPRRVLLVEHLCSTWTGDVTGDERAT